jgi:mitochondrial fission protein ELM1
MDAENISASLRVWCLLGRKTGDNAQVLALAEALGWPCEAKRLSCRRTELLTNLLLGPNLLGLQRGRSSPLRPPWPDLVITSGRRNEPIARWIRRRSGGSARLVHIGRPWARPQRWDLILTTPQYQVPRLPNVQYNEGVLYRVPEDRLRRAAASWRPRLAHLPAPWIAVLGGGHSGPYIFDQRAARRLAGEAEHLARRSGGSLLVTTSARTPPAAAAVLADGLSVPHYLYRWQPQAEDNPYMAFLALADAFIVTGESASMLGEACARGKPVYIFDPGRAGNGSGRSTLGEMLRGLVHGRHQVLVHWLLMRIGPRRMRRDVRILQRHLMDSGRAVRLGEEFHPGPPPPPPRDLERSVERVRSLFAAVPGAVAAGRSEL